MISKSLKTCLLQHKAKETWFDMSSTCSVGWHWRVHTGIYVTLESELGVPSAGQEWPLCTWFHRDGLQSASAWRAAELPAHDFGAILPNAVQHQLVPIQTQVAQPLDWQFRRPELHGTILSIECKHNICSTVNCKEDIQLCWIHKTADTSTLSLPYCFFCVNRNGLETWTGVFWFTSNSDESLSWNVTHCCDLLFCWTHWNHLEQLELFCGAVQMKDYTVASYKHLTCLTLTHGSWMDITKLECCGHLCSLHVYKSDQTTPRTTHSQQFLACHSDTKYASGTCVCTLACRRKGTQFHQLWSAACIPVECWVCCCVFPPEDQGPTGHHSEVESWDVQVIACNMHEHHFLKHLQQTDRQNLPYTWHS